MLQIILLFKSTMLDLALARRKQHKMVNKLKKQEKYRETGTANEDSAVLRFRALGSF